MADISQVMFTHQELVAALLRAQGIRSGHWSLTAHFQFMPSNFTIDNMGPPSPGAVVIVDQIGVQRVDAAMPGITVDAAELLA